MDHGIVAGSFDPITNGHTWLVRQALKVVKQLTVVVGINPSKKYMFSTKERVDIVSYVLLNSLGSEEFERVTVVPLEGQLLVNYARTIEADCLVRGIRNTVDFTYEAEILLINRKIQPGVETIYLVPPRELTEVSSSTVKGLVGFEGWQDSVKDYVHPYVIAQLEAKSAPVASIDVSPTLTASSKPCAQEQLRGWTDGPKIVLDYHGVVTPNDAYTVVSMIGDEDLGYREFNGGISMHATIFVKGNRDQFESVKSCMPNHNVVHLGQWRKE